MTRAAASKGNERPRRWPRKPLRHFAELQLGKMLDKAKNKGTPTKYLRNINIRWFNVDLTDLLEMPFTEAEQEKFAIRNGDILICEGGEPGRTAIWTGGNTAIKYQKAIHRVRLHPGHCSKWVAYQLYHLAQAGRLTEHFSGTTIKHLPQEALAEIEFLTPSEPEQARIVAKLDSLLARSRSARAEVARVLRLVDRYKRAVLGAAFRGELTQSYRDGARTQRNALADAVAAMRSTHFRKSGTKEKPPLPITWTPDIELPRGWEWISADALSVLVQYGSSAKTVDASGPKFVPVLRMGNIIDGNLSYENLKYLPANHDEFPDLLLAPGDILFNRTNSAELVGKSAVFQAADRKTSFASYLIRLRIVGYLPELLSADQRQLDFPAGDN